MKQKVSLVAVFMVSVLGIGATYAAPAHALKCSVLPQSICGSADKGNLEDSGTWKLLIFALNILTAGIGIVAVGAIVYAAFLYTTAQDDSNKTKEAKDMIRNTAVGLIVYGLMYVALQFLIPGGVFA